MSRFWEKSKKPYFRVIMGVPGHAQCENFNRFSKFTNSIYFFYYFTRLDKKLAKSDKLAQRYRQKGVFRAVNAAIMEK